MEMAETVFSKAGIKINKDQKLKALFFLGRRQADQLAEAAIQNVSDSKIILQILQNNPSVDIAMFGRMVADDPSLNEDASVQVAHAISTHEVQTEFDFYTALDDLAPEDNAGAGMLGTIEYNSSTLYRYANIAMHNLIKQLGNREQAIAATKLFIQAFANSMPTGKTNTFANLTLPHILMINIRQDRPVNLVTAFENPIKSYMGSRNGHGVPSVERLFAELKKSEKFVQKPLRTLYVLNEDVEKPENYADATEETNISDLLNNFEKYAEKNA